MNWSALTWGKTVNAEYTGLQKLKQLEGKNSHV